MLPIHAHMGIVLLGLYIQCFVDLDVSFRPQITARSLAKAFSP